MTVRVLQTDKQTDAPNVLPQPHVWVVTNNNPRICRLQTIFRHEVRLINCRLLAQLLRRLAAMRPEDINVGIKSLVSVTSTALVQSK